MGKIAPLMSFLSFVYYRLFGKVLDSSRFGMVTFDGNSLWLRVLEWNVGISWVLDPKCGLISFSCFTWAFAVVY